MATPQVVQYIKDELERGTVRAVIESNLYQNGWNREEVARGFADAEGQNQAPASPPPPAPAEVDMQTAMPEDASQGGDGMPPRDNTSEVNTGDADGDLPGPMALLSEAFNYSLGRIWHLLGIVLVFGVIGSVLYGIMTVITAVVGGAALMSAITGAGEGADLPEALNLEALAGSIVFVLALSFLVGIFLQMWYQAAFLYGIASREPVFGKALGRGFSLILPFLATMLAFSLAVWGGSTLFVIPGIIFYIWFMFAPFIVVDETESVRGYRALVRSREYMSNRSLGVLGRLLFLALPYIALQIFIVIALAITGGDEPGALLGILTFALSVVMVLFYLLIAPSYTFLIYSHLKRINPNPEPASKLRGWAIGFSIWGILVMTIFPILVIGTLSSINSARSAGQDAATKAQIGNVRSEAALYFAENDDSYDGFCGSGIMDSIQGSVTCNDGATGWAISSPLSESDGHYCADGTGFTDETTEGLAMERTECPIQ